MDSILLKTGFRARAGYAVFILMVCYIILFFELGFRAKKLIVTVNVRLKLYLWKGLFSHTSAWGSMWETSWNFMGFFLSLLFSIFTIGNESDSQIWQAEVNRGHCYFRP